MDPNSFTTAWTVAKTAADISSKLFNLGKSLQDHAAKHEIDEILEQVRDLKQAASELEDENRELREKLRFKSDDYEFKNPYWFDKAHPDRLLCPTCFANGITAPMSQSYPSDGRPIRGCLVCYKNFGS